MHHAVHVDQNIGWRCKYMEFKDEIAIALEIAFSNFQKEKRSFWSKIFGGRKDFTLLKT